MEDNPNQPTAEQDKLMSSDEPEPVPITNKSQEHQPNFEGQDYIKVGADGEIVIASRFYDAVQIAELIIQLREKIFNGNRREPKYTG